MPSPATLRLTITFTDPSLEAEDRDAQAQSLLAELKQMDEVESASRVPDPNPPAEAKSIGGFLIGVLTTEVSVANAQKLMRFLGDRLGGKPIELAVEANGKKLSVKVHNREDLQTAIQAAQDFINA